MDTINGASLHTSRCGQTWTTPPYGTHTCICTQHSFYSLAWRWPWHWQSHFGKTNGNVFHLLTGVEDKKMIKDRQNYWRIRTRLNALKQWLQPTWEGKRMSKANAEVCSLHPWVFPVCIEMWYQFALESEKHYYTTNNTEWTPDLWVHFTSLNKSLARVFRNQPSFWYSLTSKNKQTEFIFGMVVFSQKICHAPRFYGIPYFKLSRHKIKLRPKALVFQLFCSPYTLSFAHNRTKHPQTYFYDLSLSEKK